MNMRSLRVAVPLIAILAAGCAASPPKDDPRLEQARAELEALKSDEQVQAHAAAELLDAEQALKRAEEAHGERENARRDHHYYLAKRYLETARVVTDTQLVQQETLAIGEESKRLALAARESEIARQREEMEAMEAELSALEAKRTERGMLVTLDDVFFETAGATLAPGASRSLDKIVSFLKKNPEQEIVVEGHTDAVGGEAYNQSLSERRANAVKDAIVAQGIEPDRIVARGYGENRPVATNATQAGRQLNRRVEIIFPNGNGSG